MKAFQSPLLKKNFFTILFLFCLPVIIISCATAAVHESPMRYGYGVAIAPGVQLGDSKASAHALVSYERIKLNGGGGHANFWQFGGQFRWSFADKPTANGFWAGGEITYLSIRNKYDDVTVKQTASGFTAGPIAGYKFLIGTLPLSIYAAPAFLSRGKFSNNGVPYGEGHTGFLGRIGIDVHFASLLFKKGR